MNATLRRTRRPVLVLPGFAASDNSTLVLRAQLRALGHPVHGWGLGRNEGPSEDLRLALAERFDELFERRGQPVSLIGWSLGGVYALALARRSPERVRHVIALGSPMRDALDAAPDPLDMPITSIWSRQDGVVSWRRSAIDAGPRRENIEVRSGHITLGFDPLVLAAVTDRLAQPSDRWTPYRPPSWLAPAYPSR